MVIYKLTTYAYSNYSYNGVTEAESFYFQSAYSAEKEAENQGLKIVGCIQLTNPEKECTIDDIVVI